MATFMAKQFAVERLVAIAGANSFIGQWPNEAAREQGHVAVPAPWVCEPGRTAASRMYSFGDLHGRVCPLWTPAQVAQRLPGVARQVEKLINSVSAERFSRMVSTGKKITDYLAEVALSAHAPCARACSWLPAREPLGSRLPPRTLVPRAPYHVLRGALARHTTRCSPRLHHALTTRSPRARPTTLLTRSPACGWGIRMR